MAIPHWAAVLILAAAPAAYAGNPVDAPLPPDIGPIEAPVGTQMDAVRSYVPQLLLVYPAPRYTCYSHNHHRLDCYPCFCERHYRRPYNYRAEFDYPWHHDVYGINNDGYAINGPAPVGECLNSETAADQPVPKFGQQSARKTRIVDLTARANAANPTR